MKPSGSGYLLFECFLITISFSLLRFFSCFLFLPDSVLEDGTFLRIYLLLYCQLIGMYLLASVYYDPLDFYAVSCKLISTFIHLDHLFFLVILNGLSVLISFHKNIFYFHCFFLLFLVSISFISFVIFFISSTKFGFCLFCSF